MVSYSHVSIRERSTWTAHGKGKRRPGEALIRFNGTLPVRALKRPAVRQLHLYGKCCRPIIAFIERASRTARFWRRAPSRCAADAAPSVSRSQRRKVTNGSTSGNWGGKNQFPEPRNQSGHARFGRTGCLQSNPGMHGIGDALSRTS
jgi:hypothetical protein